MTTDPRPPSPPSPSATTTLPATSSPGSNLPARLHRTGPLLRDLDERGERLLALRLLALAKLLGLHQIPDESQLLQLAAFVRRQFPDLTEAELVHAVERWGAGALAPDLRLFGTLSLDWLGGVLSAWRAERVQALREAHTRAEREAAEAQPEKPAVPDRFHDQLVREYVREHGTLPLIADWDACWRYLMATGALLPLSLPERHAFEQEARAELDAQVKTDRLQGKRTDHHPDPDQTAHWHAHLRARRVQQYYLPKRPTA